MSIATNAPSRSGRASSNYSVAPKLMLILAFALVVMVAAIALAHSNADVSATDTQDSGSSDIGDTNTDLKYEYKDNGKTLRFYCSLGSASIPTRGSDPYDWEKDSRYSGITKIWLDNDLVSHITSIGDHAFENCMNLEELQVDDGGNCGKLSNIGAYAFFNCPKLEFPNSIVTTSILTLP